MKHLAWIVLWYPLLFSGAVFGNTLNQQRIDFLQAEKLLAQGNTAAFMQASAALIEYPLYPYLQYQWLKDNLYRTDQVLSFLTTYKNTRYAGLLRSKWLDYLAKSEQWDDLVRYYESSENTELECEYNLALHKTGNPQQALAAAERIWAIGDSLPQSCDPLMTILSMSPSFTPELVWRRFELALRKDNVSVAEYVRRIMTGAEQNVADTWLRVHQKPELIANSGFLSPQMGGLFVHGVERLAKSDLALAIRVWDQGKAAFVIDNQAAQQLERNLALSLARSRDPSAYERLSRLPAVDTEVNEWKLRSALLEQNWQHVAEVLSGLTEQERRDPKWQYWLARSFDKAGDSTQAQNVYAKLAEDRSFYGFLAADYVGKPYQFGNKPIFAMSNELENLANEGDFKVVAELRFFNRDMEAERQWWYAIKKLSKDRLTIAAKLAQQWHWDQVAIATLVKADYWDDLSIRFPVYYAGQVQNNASMHDLDPAIVFGLIRQESIFNKNAESAVGARGLMQLMPKTGMQIAHELKEKWLSDNSLFNPDVNVRYGAFYYKKLLKQFRGHFALATAAYNAGAGRVAKWLPNTAAVPADVWIETIPFKETRKYVTSVLSYAIIYQQLMQRSGLKIKELMLDVLPG